MSAPPPYPGTGDKAGPPPPNPAYPAQQPAYPQQPYGQPAPGYQQGGYPPQPPMQPGQTTVVVQPVSVVAQQFRESPVQTCCPHCKAEVVTGVSYDTGTLTWIVCAVLCVIGCDFGCCLIPFCVDGCKDVIHTCPNCRQIIQRWNRM